MCVRAHAVALASVFRWSRAAATLLLLAPQVATAESAVQAVTREVGPCRIHIRAPDPWNGTLLLLAHGYRPADTPLLAEFSQGSATFDLLAREGWMVAATSYRRNGLIVADAAADVDELRRHIEAV